MTAAYSGVTPSSATAATDQDSGAVVPTYLAQNLKSSLEGNVVVSDKPAIA